MATKRQKFATQLNTDLLIKTKMYAEKNGRQIQSVVEEALEQYHAKHENQTPRSDAMSLYEASAKEYFEVYKKLAQ